MYREDDPDGITHKSDKPLVVASTIYVKKKPGYCLKI
jgi:hypothetical protein